MHFTTLHQTLILRNVEQDLSKFRQITCTNIDIKKTLIYNQFERRCQESDKKVTQKGQESVKTT